MTDSEARRMTESDARRMLATGLAMTAATVLRAGVGCLELWSERAPLLIELEARARDDEASGAEAELRDELLAVARESSALAVRELQRGLIDLDSFTRPDEPMNGRPRRPYKAKR